MDRRKDSKGRVLKENETERKDGTYMYRWRTGHGKRECIYAPTLEELRVKEENIIRDRLDGIRSDARHVVLNDVYELWRSMKKGIKDNTFQGYIYNWEQFVRKDIGMEKVANLKKSDIRRYYNSLVDKRGLKIATIDGIHTVLHQVLDFAVEEGYLRNNISDNALRELKQTRNLDYEEVRALTIDEQTTFINYLKKTAKYNHYYPIFAFMLFTGLRVGELTGLRWEDVDMDENIISVNHTLVYYNHADGECYYGINTPKTKKGERTVPLIQIAKEALELEKEYQDLLGIRCKAFVDGYRNFIFVNHNGNVQNQSGLNKALKRIIRDCNKKTLKNKEGDDKMVMLPDFSCHVLRHTFATRLCEADVNIKVIQDILGHADITTTMNIYADATKDFKAKEMKDFEKFFKTEDDKESQDDENI